MTDTIDPPDDLEAVRTSYDAVADNYVSMGMGDLEPTPWLRAALTAFGEQVRDSVPCSTPVAVRARRRDTCTRWASRSPASTFRHG